MFSPPLIRNSFISPWKFDFINEPNHPITKGPPGSIVQVISPNIPLDPSQSKMLTFPLGIVIDPLPSSVDVPKIQSSSKCKNCGAFSTPFHNQEFICPFCQKSQTNTLLSPVKPFIYDTPAPSYSTHFCESGPRFLFLVNNSDSKLAFNFIKSIINLNNDSLINPEIDNSVNDNMNENVNHMNNNGNKIDNNCCFNDNNNLDNEIKNDKNIGKEYGLIIYGKGIIEIYIPAKKSFTIISDIDGEPLIFYKDREQFFTNDLNEIKHILSYRFLSKTNTFSNIKKQATKCGNHFFEALDVCRLLLDKKGGIVVASCFERPDCLAEENGRYSHIHDESDLLKLPKNKTGEKIGKMANEFHSAGISLELFFGYDSQFSKQNSYQDNMKRSTNNQNNYLKASNLNDIDLDVSSLGMISGLSGGNIHFYYQKELRKMEYDLNNFMNNEFVFDVFLSIHFRDQEIKVLNVNENAIHHNHFSYFPAFKRGNNFSFEFELISNASFGVCEVVFIYTNMLKERLVRIISFQLNPVEDIQTIFRTINPIVLNYFFVRDICRSIIALKDSTNFRFFHQISTENRIKICNSLPKNDNYLLFEKLCLDLNSSLIFQNRFSFLKKFEFLVNFRPKNLIDSILMLTPKIKEFFPEQSKMYIVDSIGSSYNDLVIHFFDRVYILIKNNSPYQIYKDEEILNDLVIKNEIKECFNISQKHLFVFIVKEYDIDNFSVFK